MDLYLYGLFLLAGFSMAYSPGPSVLYTVIATWKYGKRNMLSRVVGQICSLIFYGFVSFLGIGLLMEKFPNFIPLLAIVGACYLFYVGWSQFVFKEKEEFYQSNLRDSEERDSTSIFQGFREGFFIGMSNPKIMLVYLVIIPQFVSKEFSVPFQMAVLIGSQWLIKSSSLFLYVQLADSLQKFLNQPRKQMLLINLFSLILISIAIFIFINNAVSVIG